jgi:hypothetical protein
MNAMKQQVLVIHGGDSFKSYEEYLDNLKSKELSLDRIRPNRDWKNTLHEDLDENFDVLYPSFPNKHNANYEEWKIMFEKVLDIADKDLILVGHSLGGMFLVKYLSENKIDKNIKGLFIVASPYKKADEDDRLSRFAHTGDIRSIAESSDNIYFIQSKDDVVVDFENLENFRKQLPDANYLVLEDRNHFFTKDSLPEIVELIKRISV